MTRPSARKSAPRLLLILRAAALALIVGAPLAQAADTPVSAAQAQFGGQCAEGLAEGKHVVTDCSLTWNDKDGKIYCFSGEASKKSFLASPSANVQKARDFFAASSTESTEKAMQSFDSKDAEALVTAHIESAAKANNGVFPLDDPLNGDHLKLIFDGDRKSVV